MGKSKLQYMYKVPINTKNSIFTMSKRQLRTPVKMIVVFMIVDGLSKREKSIKSFSKLNQYLSSASLYIDHYLVVVVTVEEE